MQQGVQHLGEWLRKEWWLFPLFAVNGLNGLRASRGVRRSLNERKAVNWPAVEGIARCRVLPGGLGQGAVHIRAVPVDGSELAYWSRTFPTWEEGKHYSMALDGERIAIHVNPKRPEERVVCWEELRRTVPGFVLPHSGRMGAAAFRRVRAFQTAVVVSVLLFVTDLGLFATPWGRSFEWHGLCLCDLSVALLVISGLLLIPAFALHHRIGAVRLEENGGVLRLVSRWLIVVSAGAWAGLLLFLGVHHGEAPDAMWYGLITIPVLPMLWRSGVVGMSAEQTLRPLEVEAVRSAVSGTAAPAREPAELVEANGLR